MHTEVLSFSPNSTFQSGSTLREMRCRDEYGGIAVRVAMEKGNIKICNLSDIYLRIFG
jgi:hypothetical protein